MPYETPSIKPGAPRARVAVVGAGPAGAYVTEALTKRSLEVDVFERLPCPFGLVRYGVAPDHPRVKSIAGTLARIFTQPNVQFWGNVEIGRDLTIPELHNYYDAIVVASGAAAGRRLDMPGALSWGNITAADFVSWYNGHPDASDAAPLLKARSVAIIGMGNVALDVARMFARPANDFKRTDVPLQVLDALQGHNIEEIHVLGRRGALDAKFSSKELRELDGIPGLELIVDPRDLTNPPPGHVNARSAAQRNYQLFHAWASRPRIAGQRRVHFHFWVKPEGVLSCPRVTALTLRRTNGTTKHVSQLAVQLVIHSIGYDSTPIAGFPFDHKLGVIPNDGGRVVRTGQTSDSEYVAGWVKRGPHGVIGTNRRDAKETVDALLHDLARRALKPLPPRAAVQRLLTKRRVDVVKWAGWEAISRAETERGPARGSAAVKLSSWTDLLAADRTPKSKE